LETAATGSVAGGADVVVVVGVLELLLHAASAVAAIAIATNLRGAADNAPRPARARTCLLGSEIIDGHPMEAKLGPPLSPPPGGTP